jgi:hypothetical protein
MHGLVPVDGQLLTGTVDFLLTAEKVFGYRDEDTIASYSAMEEEVWSQWMIRQQKVGLSF